jgi:hypothetical protein
MTEKQKEYRKKACERIGLLFEQIVKMSQSEFRNYVEQRIGEMVRYCSEFPTIGRGSQLRAFVTPEQTRERVRYWIRRDSH